MDFTKQPARMYADPKQVVLIPGPQLQLSTDVQTLSDIIDNEFRQAPDHTIKNSDGKIGGWNGGYLNAQQWQYSRENPNQIHIPVTPMRVSDDLAAAHLAIVRDGNHSRNPVSALGGYIPIIVKDSKGNLVLYIEHRDDEAFLAPGKYNSPGASVPVDRFADPLRAVAEKIAKKSGFAQLADRATPVGILKDQVNNITLVCGVGIFSEDEAPTATNYVSIPAKEFQKFMDKNPLHKDWLEAGFYAVAHGIKQAGVQGVTAANSNAFLRTKAKEYVALGDNLIKVQESLLQANPVHKRTVVQNLGIDLPEKYL
jgi:hypothetical protein